MMFLDTSFPEALISHMLMVALTVVFLTQGQGLVDLMLGDFTFLHSQ